MRGHVCAGKNGESAMSQPNHARNIGIMIVFMSIAVATLISAAVPVTIFTLVCYLLLMGAATFGGFLFAIGCAEPEAEKKETES
jgi:hypothetical protein